MNRVNVVQINYNDFVVEESFCTLLLQAIAAGKIKNCTKSYVEGSHKVVVGSPVKANIELCEVISTRDKEIAELRERLKKLETPNVH